MDSLRSWLEYILRNKGQSFLVFLTVFSSLVAIYGLPFWYQKTARVVWKADQFLVLKADSDFDLRRSAGIMPDKNIYETQFTFWNNGNDSVENKDVRRPVAIVSNTKGIVDAKILDVISATPGNFKITTKPDKTTLSWIVFDPGDAVKVAILHNGSWETLDIEGILRPNSEFRRYSQNTTSALLFYLFSGVIVGIIASYISDRIKKISLRIFFFVVCTIIIVGLVISQIIPKYLLYPITIGTASPL